jgi:predicted nicotinamide N-methyase
MMGDNRFATHRFGVFDAQLTHVALDDDTIALWQVQDLERHVDRHALLAGDDPDEPPYWAHLWSGARVLASAVPRGVRSAIELGCGLALPSLAAARRGARVVCVDRDPVPLAFARASAQANDVADAVHPVAADVTSGAVGGRFDLVLAAEVLYDRSAFPRIAQAIADRMATDGVALLTDGHRIDTRAFPAALASHRLDVATTDHVVREEGFPVTISLLEIRHAR